MTQQSKQLRRFYRLVGETAMVTEPIDACADTGAVKINGVL